MSLLTEERLRFILRHEDLDSMKEFRVDGKTIVTPAARSFLSDHHIRLHASTSPDSGGSVLTDDTSSSEGTECHPRSVGSTMKAASEDSQSGRSHDKRYVSLDGSYFEKKPEYMTVLRGRTLVNKDHKIIRFRGKLDSFQAKIIMAQLTFSMRKQPDIVQDLEQILHCARAIMRAEVLNEPLLELDLLGMDEQEIHERSHHPKQYLGIDHVIPEYTDGEGVACLNELRTYVREVELTAYDAFRDEDGKPVRNDIIQTLNRLSSLFYVMMLRILAEDRKVNE